MRVVDEAAKTGYKPYGRGYDGRPPPDMPLRDGVHAISFLL